MKQDDPMRVWLTRLSLGAGVAFTATAEYQLARSLGANEVIAAMLPLAVDAYVIAALRWFRAFDILLSLTLMGAAQVAAHLLDAHVMRVNIPMVVIVSLLVPVAIWRTHALARRTDTAVPAVPEPAQVAQFDTPAEAKTDRATIGFAGADPEPVPVPEVQPDSAYPELPAVPETLQVGATNLTAVPEAHPVSGDVNADISGHPAPVLAARREVNADISANPAGQGVDVIQAHPVLAAEQPRQRTQVHAEYVPEPEDDSPPPPAEDSYTPKARADFADDLAAGRTPPIRILRDTYSIGQVRAQRIQRELSTP